MGSVTAVGFATLPLTTLSEENQRAAYATWNTNEDAKHLDMAVIVRMMNLCTCTFDFHDQTKHMKEKAIKQRLLMRLNGLFDNEAKGEYLSTFPYIACASL